MKSWMQHIKGAFCLFRLRDEKQLETPFGGRLLQQIRSQFVIHYCSCVSKEKHLTKIGPNMHSKTNIRSARNRTLVTHRSPAPKPGVRNSDESFLYNKSLL